MLKQITVDPQMVSAYMQDRQRIPLTVMSFDVDVHELVIPVLGANPSEIVEVLGIFVLKRADSTIQVFGRIEEDKVYIKLPIELNRYKGRFDIEINLRMLDKSTLTLAQFEAMARRSDIDANNIELKPYYFALFDELVTEVKVKRTDALKEIVTEANDAILDISEQVRLTGLAKTTAIQKIEDKAELVETTKKTALTDIDDKVASVETSKGNAIDAINNEKTLAVNAVGQAGTLAIGNVEDAQGSAIGAINEKVTTVDDAKKDATREIELKEAEVESAKNLALDNIATSEQTAYDAFFAYAEKQTADVLLANLEYIAQVDQRLLQTERKATDLSGYSGQVTLTNTETYPFNNSGVTVPISKTRYHLDYNVNVSVVSETGGFAGEVIVYDKQLNGFKIKFTGSAKNVTVKYLLTGGMYK